MLKSVSAGGRENFPTFLVSFWDVYILTYTASTVYSVLPFPHVKISSSVLCAENIKNEKKFFSVKFTSPGLLMLIGIGTVMYYIYVHALLSKVRAHLLSGHTYKWESKKKLEMCLAIKRYAAAVTAKQEWKFFPFTFQYHPFYMAERGEQSGASSWSDEENKKIYIKNSDVSLFSPSHTQFHS